MSLFGEVKETLVGRLFRYIAYFLVGILFGLLPALLVVGGVQLQNSQVHIGWQIPAAIVFGSGAIFCLVGILRRGRLIAAVLRFLGREVESP
jgi:uncharacterized membrane protein (DUF441 family)